MLQTEQFLDFIAFFTFRAKSLFCFIWLGSEKPSLRRRANAENVDLVTISRRWFGPFQLKYQFFVLSSLRTRHHSFFQNQTFHSFYLYTTACTGTKRFRYCLTVLLIEVRLCFFSFVLQAYSRCCRRRLRWRVKSVAVLRCRPTASNVLWQQCTQLHQGTQF